MDDVRSKSGDTIKLWESQWWLKNKWRKNISLTNEKLEKYFDVLKSEFDENWYLSLGENRKRHPVAMSLQFGEGLPQISHLLRLAAYIIELSHVDGFARVLKDYKSIQSARNTEFELFMAHALLKSKQDVSFITPKPKKGKTPDLLVKNHNCDYVVECKFLDYAENERWFSQYRFEYGRLIMAEIPENVSLVFIPSTTQLDITQYKFGNSLTNPLVAALVDTLSAIKYIRKIVFGFSVSGDHYIDHIGRFVWSKRESELQTSIHLQDLDYRFLMRRLINNGLNKAIKQINAMHMPGLAAIFQEAPASDGDLVNILHDVFISNPEQYANLMAVIVFPAQNILQYIRPILIENPHSKNKIDDFEIRNALYPLLQFREL